MLDGLYLFASFAARAHSTYMLADRSALELLSGQCHDWLVVGGLYPISGIQQGRAGQKGFLGDHRPASSAMDSGSQLVGVVSRSSCYSH